MLEAINRKSITPTKKVRIAVIVIPLYKEFSKLDWYELLSLKQVKKVLNSFSFILIAPGSINLSGYTTFFLGCHFEIQIFDESFFKNKKTYNKLCLSKEFYARLQKYDYFLIYQTDCYVFKNELNYWVEKDYDFIGAPWLKKNDEVAELNVDVGNGGFSLRKVSSCMKFLRSIDKLSKYYNILMKLPFPKAQIKIFRLLTRINLSLVNDIKSNRFNEDYVFGVLAKRFDDRFKVASAYEALKFSFEWLPEQAFRINNQCLPFGCHGWQNNLDFWLTIISEIKKKSVT